MSFQNEKIVETKSCQKCQASFDITDKDLEFYEKVSPVFEGKRYQIPTPKLCPECRHIRRLVWRNERNLYHRTCDSSGDQMISTSTPDTDHTIFKPDIWFGDSWDPLDYGFTFDDCKSFFTQFEKLFKEVPMLGLMVMNNSNSEYVSYCANVKDSYMIFASSKNQNSLYSRWVMQNSYVVDSNNISSSNTAYKCIDGKNINNCFYCIGVIDSRDCFGCYDMIGCSDCIGCSNLRNKQYCIFNKQYSKSEYEQEKSKLNLNHDILLQAQKNGFYRWTYSLNTENTTGEYLIDTKNIVHGFDVEKSEDCKYVTNILDMKDSMDIDFQAFKTDLCYEVLGLEESHNCSFDFGMLSCNRVLYSFFCISCSDCFGCVGLTNKQYCILNKQYSKDEYEKLIPQIIAKMQTDKQWGEYFPSSISPYGYNETIAYEYFPFNKKQAQNQGFNWSDYEAPFPKVEKTIPANKLPDNITDVPDDILNWAITCEITNKPFRIIPQELEFYRKHNLPIPRRHPDQRHLDRMALRNPRKLFERVCDKPSCNKKMQTTYSPERPEKVYCENCYNKEVY